MHKIFPREFAEFRYEYCTASSKGVSCPTSHRMKMYMDTWASFKVYLKHGTCSSYLFHDVFCNILLSRKDTYNVKQMKYKTSS